MSFVTYFKNNILVRWAWSHSPEFVRKRIGQWLGDSSNAGQPSKFQIPENSEIVPSSKNFDSLYVLKKRLQEYRLILHVSEGGQTLQNVNAWLPYCLSAEPDTLLVLRSLPLFNRLVRERKDVAVVYVRNAHQAEWLVTHMPNLKAILYDANTGNIVHFIRFAGLRHIFLGHGDSEKSASCGKHFRVYDEIWTAGRAHIERFKNSGIDFSSLKFRIVGRPQVRRLVNTAQQVQKFRFLYLPTWESYHEQQDYSSVSTLYPIIPQISSSIKHKGVVKFHPSTGRRLRELKLLDKRDQKKNSEKLICIEDRSKPVAELMAETDFLIADISSVVSDFLTTGKPIFIFIPRNRDITLSHSSIPYSEYCYIFSNHHELMSLIDQVILRGNDRLKNSRIRVRDYFIDLSATKTAKFENEIRRLIDEYESDKFIKI